MERGTNQAVFGGSLFTANLFNAEVDVQTNRPKYQNQAEIGRATARSRGIPPAHAMGLIPRVYTCSRGLKNRPVMLLCADQKGHF